MVNTLDISKAKWEHAKTVTGIRYTCGFCDSKAAPSQGYSAYESAVGQGGDIYICSHCGCPTFFHARIGKQFPSPLGGEDVKHITEKLVEEVYTEARSCMSVNSFTAATLLCRKILMTVAVANDAPHNQTFVTYVDYLVKNGFVPPNGKTWVDAIRTKGNEATHEIPQIAKEDAERIMVFTTHLLKFNYELAGMAAPPPPKP